MKPCDKCNRKLGSCVCDLSSYTNIGEDVSACGFLDNHIKRDENAGSPFFQGWAYKHNQMKFKMLELERLFKEAMKLEGMNEYQIYDTLVTLKQLQENK